MPAGMFLGKGLEPRIQALEFVEMRNLMPESWLAKSMGLKAPEPGKCCAALAKPRRPPVTDILIWPQCYAAMVGVLPARFPQAVPSPMAYQTIVIKASRDFDRLGWVQYDRAFRRQAAVTKDLNRACINITLYSICFASSAKHTSVCALCLNDSHSTENCGGQGCLRGRHNQQEQVQHLHGTLGRWQSAEIFRLYNHPIGPRCTFSPCKYAHRCALCRGAHPGTRCQRQGSNRGVSDPAHKRPRRM